MHSPQGPHWAWRRKRMSFNNGREARSKFVRTLVWVLFSIVCVALISGAAFAQAISGDVFGLVTDATGAIVPGASVSVTNNATGYNVTATSNQSGEFHFSNLPIGNY